MNISKLSDDQRRFRTNIRNFLMVATRSDLEAELALSRELNSEFRAACVQELINEDVACIQDAITGPE
jgi:membrane glycosyltransferase